MVVDGDLDRLVSGCIDALGDDEMKALLEAIRLSAALRQQPELAVERLGRRSPETAGVALLYALEDGLERCEVTTSLARDVLGKVPQPWPFDLIPLGLWAGLTAEETELHEIIDGEQGKAVGACLQWGHPAGWKEAVRFAETVPHAEGQDTARYELIQARPKAPLDQVTELAGRIDFPTIQLAALAELAVRTPTVEEYGLKWLELAEAAQHRMESEGHFQAVPGVTSIQVAAVAGRADPERVPALLQAGMSSVGNTDDPVAAQYLVRQLFIAAASHGVQMWREMMDWFLGARVLKGDGRSRETLVCEALGLMRWLPGDDARAAALATAASAVHALKHDILVVTAWSTIAGQCAGLSGRSITPPLDELERRLARAACDPDAGVILSKVAGTVASFAPERAVAMSDALTEPFLRGLWLLAVLRATTP